jgi:hypothetical protein
MRQLSDILIEKKQKLGGWAEIGRLLGGRDGQLIGKYASGKSVPALDFAIDWKKAFGENLISLMFDENVTVIEEPQGEYKSQNLVLKDLIESQKETIQLLKAEIARMSEKKKGKVSK